MPTFNGSEGSIHYERWEATSTPERVVILVHGYAEYAARYAHVAQILNSQGAVVYGEDHIGHGQSDGERALLTDFDHVVDDLRSLTDIAIGENPGLPVVMIGHSMGGLLTARFTQRFPELLAGVGFLGAVIGDWTWARDALAGPELPEPDTEFIGMSSDPEVVKGYAEDPMIYHGPYKRALLEAEIKALDLFAEHIDQLTMPVLFCHGTEDPYVDYRTSAAAVEAMPSEDKTVRLYEGARHELVNELNQDDVIAEIASFVARVA